MTAPTRLRVEHLDKAFGIDIPAPRLSWWLPAGSTRQVAYQIATETWDSGRVESDRSVLVPYAGPLPSTGETVRWRVKVWTDLGESEWSQPGSWELGIGAHEWAGQWIEPAETDPPEAWHRPAYLLRQEFELGELPDRARLYATAHGYYEFFVNGLRVGDQELAPGFTSYPSRLQVQTYDVTELLRPGANVAAAVLSDGRFRGSNGLERTSDEYGTRTALLAEFRVPSADGWTTVAATGPGWHCNLGEIGEADPMTGQRVDFTQARIGWQQPGFDASAWPQAEVATGGLYSDTGRLTTSPAPAVRRVQTLPSLSVTPTSPGVQVFDFGQNINGWVRLSDLGPRGTTLTLTYSEALGSDGDVATDYLFDLPVPIPEEVKLTAAQKDSVVSAGRPGEVFEPRHTTHGFRYVRVEGHPGDLDPGAVEAVVVHTDLRRTGWFRCSDERINRLHEAAVWSFRGNACDIPTDCPTRERDGWSGDWQVFIPTAAYLYDVAGFSVKWLRDLAADQYSDGMVTNIVPDHGILHRTTDGMKMPPHGSAGWGDAAVIVPWETYLAYNDIGVLEDQYASMRAWVEWAAGKARTARFPQRAEARPEPLPHEQYLWDGGFHFGEWLEPHDADDTPFYLRDQGAIATAYLYRSSSLLARIAAILGRTADFEQYQRFSEQVLAAWRAEYIGPDGDLTLDTQANHVRALAFGLVPVELRDRTARRLTELVRAAGTHLGTGFLATANLLPALTDSGFPGLAYELLFQDSAPSWLTMADRGATTIWEEWEGIDAEGLPHASLNHYSKGAVISFLHSHTAGIRLRPDSPGYRHFDINPVPGGGITWAKADFDSPYGRISAHWSIADNHFELRSVVPPSTTATVALPNGQTFEVSSGEHQHSCLMP
ncbi:family 78 glycoside hydrolase catalytic domain [Rhodococcus opacus]|uniref:alpha-L-rhamnosidase n=1 Tax=Rhodococcus opacus TaxID=37919 RepID=A0AAX3Y5K0_RHOOP|nr:family 78 glycoside hydrolase catalytic domain [Rhodococcus opacus]MCZ4589978.1 family 78 glycoside hydrolase catalytic domain [Rhodococcus opacus]WLF44503.1 family 78 glycoside hydrolase catalytic domain [Rhodococcus opacus]